MKHGSGVSSKSHPAVPRQSGFDVANHPHMTTADSSLAGRGLSATEAAVRLARHGPNALPETRPTPVWKRFLRQFRSPLIYILLFALAVDLAIWVIEGAKDMPVESLAIALNRPRAHFRGSACRRRDSRGLACGSHADPGAGRRAHGQTQGHRPAPVRGRGVRNVSGQSGPWITRRGGKARKS